LLEGSEDPDTSQRYLHGDMPLLCAGLPSFDKARHLLSPPAGVGRNHVLDSVVGLHLLGLISAVTTLDEFPRDDPLVSTH
jgi:hypothetical protein